MLIDAPAVVPAVVDLSSDDEDSERRRRSNIYQKVVLEPVGKLLAKDSMVRFSCTCNLYLHA